jgi:hypothetical protein
MLMIITNLQTLNHIGTNMVLECDYGPKLSLPHAKQDTLDRFGTFNIVMGEC